MIKNKKRSDKKLILVIGMLVMLTITGTAVIYIAHKRTPSKTPIGTDNGINFAPATEQDKQFSNSFKEPAPPAQQSPAPTPNTGSNAPSKKSVKPVVVDAGKYDGNIEARGYVPGVIEDGGTCTFTFTHNNTTITKQTAGIGDATTTRCENLNTPASAFTNGIWTMTVSYSSAAAEGTSDSITFEAK